MIDYAELVLLGAIAGLTIFLGLPMALLQNVNSRIKGFLNALSMGILIFLIADVLYSAWIPAKLAVLAIRTGASVSSASLDLIALFAGLGLGLLVLARYEQRYIKRVVVTRRVSVGSETPRARPDGNETSTRQEGPVQQTTPFFGSPHHLATMIAIGIGLHNFSEGLAIGQSYASGAVALALVLIVGFGAHNATEGFGIAGPLTGILERPRISYLAKLGLIGGGPTFVGTVIGSLWVSELTYVLFLSLAGGALIYVTLLMYNTARRQSSNDLIMIGIFIGLLAGFLTDLTVSLA